MRRPIPKSLSMQLLDPDRCVEEQEDNESPSKTRAEEKAKLHRPMGHLFTRTALWIIILAGILTFLALPSTVFRFRRFQQELRSWREKHSDDHLFCLQHLNDGKWHRVSSCSKTACKPHHLHQCSREYLDAAHCGFFQYAELGDNSPVTMEDRTKNIEWNWEPQVTKRCCFTRIVEEEAQKVFEKHGVKSISIVGDSSGRHVFASMLRLLSPQTPFAFERHSDIEYTAKNGLPVDTLKFFWAPYLSNITDVIERFTEPNDTEYHVVIISFGLWDMLHVRSTTRFEKGTEILASAMRRYMSSSQSKRCFWVSLSSLVDEKLLTEEKRQYMSANLSEAYNDIVRRSSLLHPLWPKEDSTGSCFPLHFHQVDI